MKREHLIVQSKDGSEYLVSFDKTKLDSIPTSNFQKKIVEILFDILDGESLSPEPSPEIQYIGPRK